MVKTTVKSFAIVVTLAVFALGCATPGGITPNPNFPLAPDVSMQVMDGDVVKLSDHRGSDVVIINFWGLRCQNCIEEMPFLERIKNKYGGKGLVLYGINTDGVDGEILKKLIPKMPIKVSYPIVLDPDFTLADTFEMMAAPLTIVIAKDGTVRFRHEGYEPEIESTYIELIEQLLAE